VANFDLVGDDVSLFIAERFDLPNRETAVVQFRLGLLQGIMQFILQFRGPRGRGEDVSVHTVDLLDARFGEQFDLAGIGWQPNLGLVVEPFAGCRQNEQNN